MELWHGSFIYTLATKNHILRYEKHHLYLLKYPLYTYSVHKTHKMGKTPVGAVCSSRSNSIALRLFTQNLHIAGICWGGSGSDGGGSCFICIELASLWLRFRMVQVTCNYGPDGQVLQLDRKFVGRAHMAVGRHLYRFAWTIACVADSFSIQDFQPLLTPAFSLRFSGEAVENIFFLPIVVVFTR